MRRSFRGPRVIVPKANEKVAFGASPKLTNFRLYLLSHEELLTQDSGFKSRTGEEQQRKNIESSSDRTASQQVSWRRSRHQRNSVRNLERKRCARPLPIQGSGQLSDRVARPRRIRSGLAS